MCCDLLNVQAQLEALEKGGADLLHLDIMDGNFVPNIALGSCFAAQLKAATNMPLDLHFMTDCPERHIDLFPMGEGDYVSIHYESTKHVQRVLQAVRAKGAKTLLALNPATPIEMATDVLDDVDGILLMTVNPGFAGQKMIPHAIEKIRRTRRFLDESGKTGAEIQVDGNVSIPNAIRMHEAGAGIFVLGTAMQATKNRFTAEDLLRFRRDALSEEVSAC
jgi:ribulose-phosphate 3-epimerase